ncbi:uncharacterized protein CCR75_007519 [Bremia lactucae]|uniref:Pre-mRNA-splicing factor Syf1-like N-terminal HAT-repeats domain-containing protein n=1 Tax=Bremia lactucae TaxID=4779 RepID=A0A976IC62_BRELC|nr:hypothetical protein CCR75_007519 [Bremia lactucae]
MSDDIPTWDAPVVVARAKALIHSSNYEKVADARKDVDDTLSTWIAAVQEHSDPKSAAKGSSAVIALWRQYAALEMELRQFKQATIVFERAVNCPIAGSNAALWLQYADFCVQRKKFSNARKIFVRALQTIPAHEHSSIWAQFYGFVCTHVDDKLSLAMLQHQVMPDQFPQPGSQGLASTRISGGSSVSSSSPIKLSTTDQTSLQPPQTLSTKAVALIDPTVVFIDKTGQVPPRAVESKDLGKRVAANVQTSSSEKRAKLTDTETATAFFLHVPVTLPWIPSCPHLLFDSVVEKETPKEIENELLERLSDVLGDSAVFEKVRDLCNQQRKRDREMLYRWQELIGTQMKEGSELFARHVALEMQHGFSDPRGLIALKTQHLDQRREFTHRCQLSQQHFIEISAVDRASALKAQQFSLETMKIPEMVVTTHTDAIELQRAIVGLILEAETLWREEQQSSAEGTTGKKTQPSSSSASLNRRQRRDSQDSTTSSHSTARSSSGVRGTGGPASSRQDSRGGARGHNSTRRRDRDARGGRGRSNKWDIQPLQSNRRIAAVSASQRSRFEYPEQQMPSYEQPLPALSQPRHFQHQPYGLPPYHDYSGRPSSMPERQAYGPDSSSGAYFSGPIDGPQSRGETDRFVGQGGPSRGGGAWPHAAFHPQPLPIRQRTGPLGSEDDFRPPYDPSLSRYGAGTGPGVAPRDGPMYGESHRVPTEALYYQEVPNPQQGPPYRQHHQFVPPSQQAPLRHESYAAAYPTYDPYGPPQGDFQQRGRPREHEGPVHPQDLVPRHHQPPPRFQQEQLPAGMNNPNRRTRRGGDGRFRR